MKAAKKGDWVQVRKVVLPAGKRAPQVPEDTSKTDLLLWVKGFAQTDADLGEEVSIKTVTGRLTSGILQAVNPGYTHGFGDYLPELAQISAQVKELALGE